MKKKMETVAETMNETARAFFYGPNFLGRRRRRRLGVGSVSFGSRPLSGTPAG